MASIGTIIVLMIIGGIITYVKRRNLADCGLVLFFIALAGALSILVCGAMFNGTIVGTIPYETYYKDQVVYYLDGGSVRQVYATSVVVDKNIEKAEVRKVFYDNRYIIRFPKTEIAIPDESLKLL